MSANPHRGEIEAELDGRTYRLCLTLGALAELEQRLGAPDLLALAERFEKGRIAAGDAICVIGAGLRGGGNDIADETVARMCADAGATGFVSIVARLLSATFGGGEGAREAPENPPQAGSRPPAGNR
jgi:hypothetical protein